MTLRLRLTEDERARWEAAAGGRGHVSEWVRRVVDDAIQEQEEPCDG